MSARTPARATAVAGLAAGLVLVVRPDQVLARLAPEYPRERRWVARLLGARLLAQHGAVLAAPRPAVVRVSAAVDLVHAVTMLPLLRSPRYGRAARISGGLAAAYGLGMTVPPGSLAGA
jgi:hypothetical protein